MGNIARLDHTVAGLKDLLEDDKRILSDAKTEYAAAKEQIKEEFPHEEELKEKKARIEQITAVLSKDKSDDQKKFN